MLYRPQPGDIGLTASRAWTGRIVSAAQALINDHSYATHAFLVLYDGDIIEARPGGAAFSRLDKYPGARFSNFDLTDDQRYQICIEGLKMYGTPYSFLDYLALGLTHWNIKPEFVRKRVTNSGKMICSQLVAEAYRRAGVDLFPDKRLPMDVTPGDLSRLVAEHAVLTKRR